MEQNVYYRMPRRVLITTLLLSFSIWAPLLVVPTLEDILVTELSLSHTQTSLVYSGPILMLALVSIPAGLLADRFGVKRITSISAAIAATGAILRGTATGFPSLMAFTLLYGLGLGISFPILPKLVRECSPRDKIYITTGIFSAGLIAAGALPLTISRPVIYGLTGSYQDVFYAWGLMSAVSAILWVVFVQDPPCRVPGALEIHIQAAALRESLRNKGLWLLAVLFFFHNIFFYTWAGWLPLYIYSKGVPVGAASAITSVVLWVGIPSVLFVTRLSSRLGVRKPFLWLPGLVMAAVSLAIIPAPLAAIWVLMVLVGISTTTRFTTILALPAEMTPPEQTGTASGLVMSIGYTGALVGPLLGGNILDNQGSFEPIFLILAAVSLAAVGISLTIKETGRQTQSESSAVLSPATRIQYNPLKNTEVNGMQANLYLDKTDPCLYWPPDVPVPCADFLAEVKSGQKRVEDYPFLTRQQAQGFHLLLHASDYLPAVPLLNMPRPIPPQLFPVNNPGEDALVLVTGNNQYSFEVLAAVWSQGLTPAYFLLVDCLGNTVDMAMVFGTFTPERLVQALRESNLESKVRHRHMVVPGWTAPLAHDFEGATGWEVEVGPINAAELPLFLGELWIPA